MHRLVPVLFVILLALFGAAVSEAHAQRTFSIAAWVDKGECTSAPTFDPTLNGKPAKVSKELSPRSDQVILLVFDLTGDISRIDEAKQAIIKEISRLPSNTWVGVLRSQDGLHVLTDPTPDRQKVTNIIQSLSSNGTPGLLETVRAALSLADAMILMSPVRVSVLYITDGSIYNYREDYTDPVINPSDTHDLSRRFQDVLVNEKISKLKSHIGSLEAPLFVVDLQYRENGLDVAYQNGLDSLAQSTGGETVVCRSMPEISQAISHIFLRMTNVWRLVLVIPPRAHRNLQVGLKATCGNGGLQLSWRPRFNLKEE